MRLLRTGIMALSSLCGLTTVACAQDEFERAPIQYSASTPDNQISRLQGRVDRGESVLNFSGKQGYLEDLLTALEIPVESQTLVFSKTSLQVRRISPRTPRALYFNDDVYVGYVHLGDLIEISVADPQLGAVFYTLRQDPAAAPRFERQTDSCLTCHSSSRTAGVPGHLMRSLYVSANGQPIFAAGSRTVDHTTPFEKRWGGWYVTGSHGTQKHQGNLIIDGDQTPEKADNTAGHNLLSLKDRLDVGPYLSSHSDIVALMVLEHQILVHNRLTKANFSVRQALDYDSLMRKTLNVGDGKRLESTDRRIRSAGDSLLEALLLVGEAPLTEPVQGTSGYAELFMDKGPRDSRGRSLRDLDLRTRLFKYPCSFLIGSESYTALPGELRSYVEERLGQILCSEDGSKSYAHLSPQDRQNIAAILRETMPEITATWPSASAATVLPTE